MAGGSDGDRKVRAVLCDWYLTQDSSCCFGDVSHSAKISMYSYSLKTWASSFREMKRKANAAASSKGPACPLTHIFSSRCERKCGPSPMICPDLPCGKARCLVVEHVDWTNKRTRNNKSTQNRFYQFKVTKGTQFSLAVSRMHSITNKNFMWLMNAAYDTNILNARQIIHISSDC